MWADTLLRTEQIQLVRLVFWAALSIVAGTVMMTLTATRSVRSPLVQQFSVQTMTWGVAEACLAAAWWRGLHLRDASGAAELSHLLWLGAGVELACMLVGAVLVVMTWRAANREATVGAGLAIATQALALLVLDVQLVSHIVA